MRLKLVLLILLILGTQAAAAQTNTPFIPPTLTLTPSITPSNTLTLTPTVRLSPTISPTPRPRMQAFIASAPMEILFPSGAIFSAAMVRPANELGIARLEIEIEGNDEPIIYEDLARAFVDPDDPFKLLVVLEQLMPVFGSIHYRWTIDGGYETGIADAEVTYVDPQETEWVTNIGSSGGVTLYSAGRGYPLLTSALDQAHAFLSSHTVDTEPIRFALYRDGLLPSCQSEITPEGEFQMFVKSSEFDITFACDPSVVEQALELGNVEVISAADTLPFEVLERTLFERLLSRYYSWFGTGRVPAWFETGLRLYLAPEPLRSALFDAQTAARANAVFSNTEMRVPPPATASANRRSLWNAQSYGMVLYLIDQVGIDGLLRLAAAIEDQPFELAYQDILGQPVDLLVQTWTRWLFSDSAAYLYNTTPYLPSTFTPTSSYTPSNTPTVSQTSTPTDTPTSTPARRSPTPPPTVTPSRTAPPSPPTPTPRSMTDLATPTAALSTPTSGILQNEQSRLILIGMLVVIVILLVTAYILASRRK